MHFYTAPVSPFLDFTSAVLEVKVHPLWSFPLFYRPRIPQNWPQMKPLRPVSCFSRVLHIPAPHSIGQLDANKLAHAWLRGGPLSCCPQRTCRMVSLVRTLLQLFSSFIVGPVRQREPLVGTDKGLGSRGFPWPASCLTLLHLASAERITLGLCVRSLSPPATIGRNQKTNAVLQCQNLHIADILDLEI